MSFSNLFLGISLFFLTSLLGFLYGRLSFLILIVQHSRHHYLRVPPPKWNGFGVESRAPQSCHGIMKVLSWHGKPSTSLLTDWTVFLGHLWILLIQFKGGFFDQNFLYFIWLSTEGIHASCFCSLSHFLRLSAYMSSLSAPIHYTYLPPMCKL